MSIFKITTEFDGWKSYAYVKGLPVEKEIDGVKVYYAESVDDIGFTLPVKYKITIECEE